MPSATKYVSEIRKQGHWAAAGQSTVATVTPDDDEQVASALCRVKTTNEMAISPNGNYKKNYLQRLLSFILSAY